MKRMCVLRAYIGTPFGWFALPGCKGSDITEAYPKVDDVWQILLGLFIGAEGIE